MRLTSIFRLRLRSLFSRKRVEQELDEELRYHLERQIEEEIAAGRSPEDARYPALQSIKDIEQRKDECRDMRGIRWMEDLTSDLQYGLRQFLKHKSFFAIAGVTLALGIGANTAIFSAVNSVLLRPLPYRHAERLAAVWCMDPSRGIPQMGCALPDLREIAARNHSFEAFANYYGGDVNITGGTPERVPGVYASANLFPLLGVNPALGRAFTKAEEIFGKNHVVVLSNALWRERFGGTASAIGDTVHLNGEEYIVIGVMPADFQFPDRYARLWMPMSFAPKDDMATRDNHFIDAIARLRPGVSFAQARTEVQSIARQLEREFSQNAGLGADASDYLSSVVGDVRPALLILLGAVGVVLLIACVNVANLLLSRASGRQRELSVRAALGASRARLIRQLLSESVLLGGVGACLGVALSVWLVRLIRAFGPDDVPRLQTVQIDATVLAFAAAVALLSVVLFGLAPAMGLARVQVSEALKEGGRSLTAGARTSRARDVLVIAEITLSLVLMISAGLLLRTFRRLQQVDPGFKPENVLTMSVTLPEAKYPETDPAKTARFYDELTKRLERVPGVRAVGASTAIPIADWGGWGKYFTVEERAAARLADVPGIQYREVTPHFVEALGIPVVEGRFFTQDDTGDRPLVAVINESARKRFFPNEDPIGKRVYPNPPEATIAKMLPSPGYRSPRLTIVGVIGDVKQAGLSQPAQPELFVPHLQGTVKNNQPSAPKMFLFIKADSDPLRFVNAARRIVQSLDPEQPVADVATMEQRLKASLATQRFQLVLFGGFAALALVLAAVGIYGVLSYSVRIRMHEIGIRMALGACGSDVLKMVVKHGLALGLAGVLIGTGVALGVTRLMTSLLFGIRANDAITFLAASLVLMAVVAAASFVPSVRAARTDALTILRTE
jgi:putative ABC transport system permease protein